MRRFLLCAVLLAAACSDKANPKPGEPPPRATVPEPLPSLAPSPVAQASDAGQEDREALFRVEPAPVHGEKVPGDATRLELAGSAVKLGGSSFEPERPADAAALRGALGKGRPVLLVPDEDTFLVQAAPLLALLDDAGLEVWLLHPGGAAAYPLVLRDEPAFQAWLDEPKPGKIRVIQRSDGYELSTNIGKLPGADPNGPSVPLRGGQLDIATLRRGLGLLKQRFKKAEDSCIVPTFGTELRKVALSLSAYFEAPGEPVFGELCLVYPRPVPRDGG